MVINSANIGSAIGLALIIIGWLLQLMHSWKGRRELRKMTLIFYNLGVAVIIINSIFVVGIFDAVAYLNVIALVITSILLIRISNTEVKGSDRAARRKKKR